jgi:hypothetical protein
VERERSGGDVEERQGHGPSHNLAGRVAARRVRGRDRGMAQEHRDDVHGGRAGRHRSARSHGGRVWMMRATGHVHAILENGFVAFGGE